MSIKKLSWMGVVPALLLAVSSVSANASRPEQGCVFREFSALSVAPYRAEEDFGLGSYTRLRGAQLYVPARPGLTAEWLSQRVQSELASAGSCRPSVPGVQVQVVSAGTGFWIVLSTGDERAAASLLAWAQRIVPAAR